MGVVGTADDPLSTGQVTQPARGVPAARGRPVLARGAVVRVGGRRTGGCGGRTSRRSSARGSPGRRSDRCGCTERSRADSSWTPDTVMATARENLARDAGGPPGRENLTSVRGRAIVAGWADPGRRRGVDAGGDRGADGPPDRHRDRCPRGHRSGCPPGFSRPTTPLRAVHGPAGRAALRSVMRVPLIRRTQDRSWRRTLSASLSATGGLL